MAANQPLSLEIMAVVPPERLHIPVIKPYAGITDPMDHLDLFTSHMMVQDTSDAIWCKVFLVTLEGHACACLKQNQGESLNDFVSRFNMEALTIENFDHSIFLAGQRSISMLKKVMQAKRGKYTEKNEKKRYSEENKSEGRREDRKEKPYPRWELSGFTPLNASRVEILATIEGNDYLKKLLLMRAPSNKRNRNKYCRFHRDYGHDTKECHQLKEEIQELINQGFLRSFVAREMDPQKGRERSPHPRRDLEKEQDCV
ncbi:uncharacterized protein LOC127788227 [Diospyros lotus]|uniref:uncharacterized protein LOC127788227 n=1 Tax=Diospyros lotus TaxID=55363 RepID=UPI0022501185|nr:uncharacterized protein LOC127788227 [Diospyros lotus]